MSTEGWTRVQKKRARLLLLVLTGNTSNIPGGVVFCVKYIESFVRLKERGGFFFPNRSSLPF